jgi:single-stranded DNA-binding protein
MPYKKVKELSVGVRKYTDQSGQEKTQWENIGAIFKNEEGKSFISIKRTFNPAGVPNPENKDSVAVSIFDPKDDKAAAPAAAPAKAAAPIDDDIPF